MLAVIKHSHANEHSSTFEIASAYSETVLAILKS